MPELIDDYLSGSIDFHELREALNEKSCPVKFELINDRLWFLGKDNLPYKIDMADIYDGEDDSYYETIMLSGIFRNGDLRLKFSDKARYSRYTIG